MHEQWYNLWLYRWHSLLPETKELHIMRHVKIATIHRIKEVPSCILYTNNFTIIYVVDYSQLMLGSDVMIIMHVHGASMICGYQVFIVKK